jgi:hypothetical protein
MTGFERLSTGAVNSLACSRENVLDAILFAGGLAALYEE